MFDIPQKKRKGLGGRPPKNGPRHEKDDKKQIIPESTSVVTDEKVVDDIREKIREVLQKNTVKH